MPRKSNFQAGAQAAYAAQHPANYNPGGARPTPSAGARGVNPATGGSYSPAMASGVANPKTFAVNPEAYKVMQAAMQPRPTLNASSTVGDKGIFDSIKSGFGSAARVAATPVTAPVSLAMNTWGKDVGETALGYGNRSRYQGSDVSGYRSTSGPMAPAQRAENLATNVFMRAGERYGENLEAKYQAPVGYAKAAKQVVTHPIQSAKAVKKAVGTVIEHPSVLGNIAQEAVTSTLTDPTTYAALPMLGGALAAERAAARAGTRAVEREVGEQVAESATAKAVAEGAEAVGRRSTSSGRALEAIENLPRLREEIGLKPEGAGVRAKRWAVEKVLPGEQKNPIKAIVKEQAIGSPLPPDPGGAFNFRMAKYRATRAGQILSAPSKYSTFEKVGKALYDPKRWAMNQPAVQQAMEAQGRLQQVSQSLQDAVKQAATANEGTIGAQIAGAIGEHPKAAAAAGMAGMLAPGAIGAFGAYQLGQKLLGGGEESPEETVPDEDEDVMEMGKFTRLGPTTEYTPGRGQTARTPAPEAPTKAPVAGPSPWAAAATGFLRSGGSPKGGGWWAGRPEFGGSGESNRFYIGQTQISRGPAKSAFGQRVKGAAQTYARERQARTDAQKPQQKAVTAPAGPVGLPGTKSAIYGNLTAAGRKPFATVFGPGAGTAAAGASPSQPVAPSQAAAVSSTISTSPGTGPYANRGATAKPRQMAFDFGSGQVQSPVLERPEQLTLGI